jgi:hypothetical protein
MKFRSRLRRLSATLLSVLMVLPSAATHAQMASAASFRVSEAGAASYDIAIRVPPGVSGLQPKLALSYGSQSGNSIVGKGWSLSGLSAIVRCPRTVAQDGVRGAVLFNANDRFCIDGQRLVAIAGVYGANGTEYRTERDNFARIFSFGVAGAGPAWFQVTTKSGQIMEYGNTADSRAEAQGSASVRIYAVNRISDRDGNYMTVTYIEDAVNGDHYPSRIDYTGNAGAPPATPAIVPGQSVQFVYEARPDSPSLYQAGSLVRNTVRLKNIQTFVGAALVTDYRIAYAVSPHTSRSRVTSVTECPPTPGACMPAIAVGWSAPSTTFAADTNWGTRVESLNTSAGGTKILDVNADGIPDLVYDGTTGLRVMLSNGSAFGADTLWGTRGDAYSATGPGLRFADLNRDGLPDVVYDSPSGVRVKLNTGTSFAVDAVWGTRVESFNLADTGRLMLMDVNGDDRPDLVYDGTTGMRVMLNTGTSFGTDTNWGARAANYSASGGGFQIVDMNGDGFPDVVYDSDTGIRVKLNSGGSAFGTETVWGTRADGFNPNSTGLRIADVNGDGLPDVVYDSASTGVRVLINKGTGFAPDAVWGTRVGSFTATAPGIRMADVNGDERADVLYDAADGVRVLLSTGSGFAADTVWGTRLANVNTSDASRVQPEDVGGDGRSDAVYDSDAGVRVLKTSGTVADLCTSLSNAVGATTTIAYKPLTDSTVYTKETTGVYPIRDIRVPIYVVASTATSNGIGGTYPMSYFYTGAKLDMAGRGMLGFHVVQSTEAQGLKSINTYRQDWPYIGLPMQIKRTRADNGVISQVDNTLACKDLDADPDVCTIAAGKRYFPYVSQSDEVVNDLNGAFINKTRTANTFDIFGNATQIVVTTLNADNTATGYVKTTVNTFTNNTTNWILGRLTRATVTSATP